MRHKTVKTSYQAVYWLIVVLHVGVAALWLIAPDLVVPAVDGLLRSVRG
jgi:hypothetical protein